MGKWATKILEMELLSENLGRELSKVVAPQLREPNVTILPSPYQHKTVLVDEKDVTVYEEKVSVGKVVFLQRIGNNWFEGTYLKWWVDGHLLISPYINFELGSPSNPLILEPWMQVNENVVWTATNNSEFDCDFEVYCHGIIVKMEDVEILLKMGLPISQRG